MTQCAVVGHLSRKCYQCLYLATACAPQQRESLIDKGLIRYDKGKGGIITPTTTEGLVSRVEATAKCHSPQVEMRKASTTALKDVARPALELIAKTWKFSSFKYWNIDDPSAGLGIRILLISRGSSERLSSLQSINTKPDLSLHPTLFNLPMRLSHSFNRQW